MTIPSAIAGTADTGDSAGDTPITLNVKTIESHTHTVTVSVTETVLQLKERLAEMLEVPSPRQRLIFRGRVMVDDKSLADYFLQDGQTIHLVTRPADVPSNQRNDAPRTSTGSTAGSGPHRLDTRDFLFSIIGSDDAIETQNFMQALTGSLPMDMAIEMHPAIIHIDGDPAAIRSLFGSNLPQIGVTGDRARTRMRASANSGRSVPLGASLPHLATIEMELTRAAVQLRNVQTILAHPADQLDRVELEPLDVPDLESVDEDVDGDTADLARMVSILTQLSETNRSMASHLQTLSGQYSQALLQPSERQHLQRVSLRAARAMYRLASVQNTVFPMLANASFVATTPGPVTYRFQPPPRNAPHSDLPRATSAGGNTGARTSNGRQGMASQPLRGLALPTLSRGAPAAPLGLIPSIMAHARASAQNANAAARASQTAATSNAGNAPVTTLASSIGTTSASSRTTTGLPSTPASANATTPQSGPAPVGQMVLGPNGSLSYTIQSPARTASRSSGSLPSYAAAAAAAANPFASYRDQTSATRFMIPADFAGAGFLDFWRNFSGQPSTPAEPVETTGTRSTQAALANTLANIESTAAATRAVQSATEQLERAINLNAMLSSARRRERPDDFSSDAEGRAVSRRRLSTQQSSSTTDPEGSASHELDELEAMASSARRELEELQSIISGPASMTPSAPALASHPTTTLASSSSTRPQRSTRPTIARSSSNDTRRSQGETSSTASSPSPSSPSLPSSANANSSSNPSTPGPAYNLGRIGVFISAILRMVDQPREDGSPRTLADVICNDPESQITPLQDLVRNVAESVTVRETRSIAEGHPAPLRNIHPVLNSFIRERALNGQQLTESNLDSVAIMFAHGIMNAVHVEEILETLTPPASIQISSEDIRRISLDVLREHFRRLIYLVVAAPTGRESNWPTFARDLVLWIRDVVGSWRVAFYGLFQERDQAEAQRIATHVVGSAIHANGRRWVELSNRATNTLVNVLCANIVPRRRGEESAGGLVGGAWPLMATAPRQNVSRSRTCMAPSLLGSTAPPAPLGPTSASTSARAFSSSTFSDNTSSVSRNTTVAQQSQPSQLQAETLSENLTRRLTEMMVPLGISMGGFESLAASSIRDAVRAELSAIRPSSSSSTPSSSSSSTSASTGIPSSNSGSTSASSTADSASSTGNRKDTSSLNNRRTRVEEVEDEEMP